MVIVTKRALTLQISSEARKSDKVQKLYEMRTLSDRLKGTSRELIETKNFFNSIIQSSADAIVASDNKKRITYFSKGAEELFELKAGDVLGTKVLDLYSPHSLKKNDRIKRSKELRKNGVIKNISMKILTPDGRPKTISLSLSLLKDANDNVMGTVGVAKDITDEVKAAKELIYLKKLSDKILAGTPGGLVLIDLEFKVTMVNKGFENITGITSNKIQGKNALEYLKIPEIEELLETMNFKQKFDYVVYQGKSLDPSEFNITLNNVEKTLIDYWTPLIDNRGKVEFVLIILQDITSRKNLEVDLKDQAEMLQRSNDLKDIFTDILRHDLLNPIGVIKNYVELLSDEVIDPLVRQNINAISRNADKAVEMIENASKLAKLEKEEDIKFRKVDLGSVLNETVENVKNRAVKKHIKLNNTIKKEYQASVSSFIEAVFLNLLTNAIKYSPGNTTITVGIEESKESLRVIVKDQGEGIDDIYKDLVFTRFERLKREGVKGTGLGLAIAKRIVGIHQGRIWVEDNPGGGSIFYVEIPKDLK
jgi:PAS domain S-box-containing protein